MSEETKTQVIQRVAPIQGGAAMDADAILADIGRKFRRVEATNRTDRSGMRVHWHQSKLRTDMLSWERKDRTIERQELCFFGKMVEYRLDGGLRTGIIPTSPDEEDQPGPRVSRSELFQPSRDLDVYVLDAASRILKGCKRDYYTQHLLEHVMKALEKLETQVMRTHMHGLDFFREIEAAGREEQQKQPQKKGFKLSLSPQSLVIYGILTFALLVAGFVFWLFFTRRA